VFGPFLFTTQAVIDNETFLPIAVGEVIEPSWSWTPRSLIYLGIDGQLTAVPPTTPGAVFFLVVGVAMTSTSIFFDPQNPTLL
jgi:hypothetical protein